jgi:protein-glutamine gamma-glutamyltransferase
MPESAGGALKTDAGHTAHPPLPAVLWTIAAFGFAVMPHMAAMPAMLSALIVLILAWRAAAGWWQWPPTPAWLRVLITVGLLGLVLVLHGAIWGRRIATALLCMMLAAKMMEMYRVRDLRLVASVCFFLIATQFLFSERLIYLAYLLIGCWIAIIALVQVQQIGEGAAPSKRRSALPARQAMRDAVRLLVLALPVALTLFVMFPRLAQPLWGLSEDAMDGRTGLSDSMSPGAIAELFIDDSPAFRVEFENNRPPPAEQRYWRGPVLWQFDGNTWRRAYFSEQIATDQVPIANDSLRYRVQLEPHERRWLLALDYPVRSNQAESRVTVDYQLVSRHPITTLTQYEVISTPDFTDRNLGAAQRMIATGLPRDRNPRTLALAEQLRDQYPDDRELITAVLRWFREDEFEYSLMTGPLGRHGADEFLFDLKSGYCEYYASAFAILMRAAGIPTRIVTGYQGGFWSEAGQYLLVRQSDAHAWTEVWLEDSGWVRIDPTAAVSPLRIRDGARGLVDSGRFMVDSDWIRNLRNQYDRIQHVWNQWVLGFDADRQRRMLDRLGLPDLSAAGIGLLMLGTLAVVLLPLALFLLKHRHRRAGSPAEQAWLIMLKRLQRRGLHKAIHETPIEFARRIQPRLPPRQAEELVQLALMFARVHYGSSRPEQIQTFIDQARAFRPTGTDPRVMGSKA